MSLKLAVSSFVLVASVANHACEALSSARTCSSVILVGGGVKALVPVASALTISICLLSGNASRSCFAFRMRAVVGGSPKKPMRVDDGFGVGYGAAAAPTHRSRAPLYALMALASGGGQAESPPGVDLLGHCTAGGARRGCGRKRPPSALLSPAFYDNFRFIIAAELYLAVSL